MENHEKFENSGMSYFVPSFNLPADGQMARAIQTITNNVTVQMYHAPKEERMNLLMPFRTAPDCSGNAMAQTTNAAISILDVIVTIWLKPL